jgi:hypothetical protein
MEIGGVLLKDAWFAAALVTLGIGLFIFLWAASQLRAGAAPPRPRTVPGPLPPRETAPSPEPDLPARPAFASAAVRNAAQDDTALMYGVLEEKFSELAKRISSLESHKSAAAPSSVGFDALMKRMDEVESEIIKIKTLIAQTPPPDPGGNTAVLADKVNTLQKMLESLTMETEAPKPS